MKPALLEVDRVSAGYGRVEVLHDVRLAVPEATVVGLVGPNGAGKTTLLRTIAGLLTPTRGEVRLDGEPLTGRSPFQVARRGIGMIPEGRGIFPALSVSENLTVQSMGGGTAESVERALEHFPQLRTRLGQRAGTLSGGEQQMLSLCRALVASPRVLLVDEISMGLAPIVVGELFATVAELGRSGTTILMVEQYLTYVLQLCEIVYVLGKGRMQLVCEPSELVGEGLHAALASAHAHAETQPAR